MKPSSLPVVLLIALASPSCTSLRQAKTTYNEFKQLPRRTSTVEKRTEVAERAIDSLIAEQETSSAALAKQQTALKELADEVTAINTRLSGLEQGLATSFKGSAVALDAIEEINKGLVSLSEGVGSLQAGNQALKTDLMTQISALNQQISAIQTKLNSL
jgi:chromosome segregation ATPase